MLKRSSDDGWMSDLWDGMVDINPASTGVDVEVRRLLIGQGVSDYRIAPLVIVVCRCSQETSSYWSVLSQEVWEEMDR